MTSRLEQHARKVSWTEERDVCVGYHTCPVCGAETPEPTMSDLIAFAKTRPNGGYLWPGESWTPPGWTVEKEEGLICPDCTAVKLAALATRRRKT